MQLVFNDSKTIIGIFRFESLHTMGFWSCIQYECLTYKYVVFLHPHTKICYLSRQYPSWYFAADFLKLDIQKYPPILPSKWFGTYFSDRNFIPVICTFMINLTYRRNFSVIVFIAVRIHVMFDYMNHNIGFFHGKNSMF